MSGNDRLMAFVIVGIAFVSCLYILLNPAAVKAVNEANYKWVGFGKEPIWFFRVVGAVGSIANGLILLHIILWKSY